MFGVWNARVGSADVTQGRKGEAGGCAGFSYFSDTDFCLRWGLGMGLLDRRRVPKFMDTVPRILRLKCNGTNFLSFYIFLILPI